METKKITIKCSDGTELKGLLWGNNAAWICKCGELNGDVTGDKGPYRIVACSCGRKYKIVSSKNQNGRWHLGPAKDIILKFDINEE